MKTNLFAFLVIVFPHSILACMSCEENLVNAQLVSYIEPQWLESEISNSRKGFFTAVFGVNEFGKAQNIKVVDKSAEILNESKLILSVEGAQFMVHRVDCAQKQEMNRNNITQIFELLF